jgi:hypothetical protein
MILTPHVSRCPGCDQFVYAIDDVFVVNPCEELGEAAPHVEPGIYHFQCFESSPHRGKVLKVFADAGRTAWPADTEFLTTLARGPDYALTLRPFTGTCALHFIPWGRLLEFPRPDQFQEFVHLVAGPGPHRPTPVNWQGRIRLRWDRGRWEIAQRQLVPIEPDFAQPDVARLQKHLTARGIDPARTPVELGAVCRELHIQPSRISCPLERLTGTFAWPDSGNSARPITIKVNVEKWDTVPLTGKELEALRQFLQTVKPPSR